MAIYISKLNTGKVTFDGVTINGALGGSSDGENLDTLELVPDIDKYEDDQYLVVEPNLDENSIHIRAGGTLDDSTAKLVLGGLQTQVALSDQDGERITIKAKNADEDGNHAWVFNKHGNIIIPNNKDVEDVAGNTVIGGGNRVKYHDSDDATIVPVDENNIYVIDTIAAPTTIKLPASGTVKIGYEFIVIDQKGNASNKEITITAELGDFIISAPTGCMIDTDYGVLGFKYVGNKNWAILYGR